jgi:hypothetical protein
MVERIFQYLSTNYGMVGANNFRDAFLKNSDDEGNLTSEGR